MQGKAHKNLILSFLLIPAVIMFGAIGYMVIEDWSFFDSIYMTVISISTTGYREVHPLTPMGRIFSMVIILVGVLAIAYVGGRAIQFFIENQVLRRRMMNIKIGQTADHYIIGGFGRMGQFICETFKANNEPFIIIENDEEKIDRLIEKEFLFVRGDATNDDDLIKAGISKAKGFIAVTGTDAENVFATLSARELNKDMLIVTRAIEDGSETKLKKAGADRVVKPYELGGNRMVQLLLRPGVTEFIDVVARKRGREFDIEEITVGPKSNLIGKTLAQSPIRKDLNIIIVAVNRGTEFIFNPKSETTIANNDILIAIGEQANLKELEKLAVYKI